MIFALSACKYLQLTLDLGPNKLKISQSEGEGNKP